jgi:hypothetical protein
MAFTSSLSITDTTWSATMPMEAYEGEPSGENAVTWMPLEVQKVSSRSCDKREGQPEGMNKLPVPLLLLPKQRSSSFSSEDDGTRMGTRGMYTDLCQVRMDLHLVYCGRDSGVRKQVDDQLTGEVRHADVFHLQTASQGHSVKEAAAAAADKMLVYDTAHSNTEAIHPAELAATARTSPASTSASIARHVS